MKYGHNKQYILLRCTFAATPCETDEGLQKTVQKMRRIVHIMMSWLMCSRSLIIKIIFCKPDIMESILNNQNFNVITKTRNINKNIIMLLLLQKYWEKIITIIIYISIYNCIVLWKINDGGQWFSPKIAKKFIPNYHGVQYHKLKVYLKLGNSHVNFI